ncbi:MAG: hemerythrin domain-containing protein [Acidiferrobacterales bacterium]|nr:hemerythrin domain-containing protein [Acidiferrobacterales bacterium]
MNIVIQDLRKDHHNFHRVLKLIRLLVNQSLDEDVKRSAVGGVLTLQMAFEYVHHYVSGVHHQVEDLVFEAYVRQSFPAHSDLERMRDEHDRLNSSVEEIKDDIARTIFTTYRNPQQVSMIKEKVSRYFQLQLNHMRFEELSVYPLVENALSINDWKEIIQQSPNTGDPAFGQQPIAVFKPLSDGVRRMENLGQRQEWLIR